MLKILINSYTCCPGMGSEQGMGWNWIMSLAQYCECFVITEGEYRPQIERWMTDEANATLAKNMHFYWNPVPQSTRNKCWNQGNWSFYPLYRKWQKKTAEIARQICNEEKIDILHQLNMIGFREPGYLWKVSKETGIPFVWGPVDAKDTFPLQYVNGAGIAKKVFLWLKNVISRLQLRYSCRVHQAAKQASVLLSASSNSVESFRKYLRLESVLMNETGCRVPQGGVSEFQKVSEISSKNLSQKTFDILWVGKLDFRKQLGIALNTISTAFHSDIILHVLGGGNNTIYMRLAKKLGISDNVIWYGAIPQAEVQKLMQQSDMMLFTSVAEGTPHVVLEAIANGLPVVCHDTCGQGDSVVNYSVEGLNGSIVSKSIEGGCGIKIPVIDPKESVKRFAQVVEHLYRNRNLLEDMSANCAERARELSWENKAKKMVELYEKAIMIN